MGVNGRPVEIHRPGSGAGNNALTLMKGFRNVPSGESNAQTVSLGGSTGTGNSWDLGGTWTDASLVSTDRTVITGPRTAAGSIPSSSFLRPLGGIEVGARI